MFRQNPRRREPQPYHPKDAPYNSKAITLEAHPPLLARHDPFVYSPEENEYAYVDEYPFNPQDLQSPTFKQGKSMDMQASNPYETTRPVVPVPPPPKSCDRPPRPCAAKSCDRTGTGSAPAQMRSHDPSGMKSRDLPPQYFVLDPEALDGDGLEDCAKAGKRDRSNEYT